jgi:hypothetical protein
MLRIQSATSAPEGPRAVTLIISVAIARHDRINEIVNNIVDQFLVVLNRSPTHAQKKKT